MYLNISKTLVTANLRHDLHKSVAIYLSVPAVGGHGGKIHHSRTESYNPRMILMESQITENRGKN